MLLPLSPLRFLYRAVDLYGSKPAVISGDSRYNYREFGHLCEGIAAGLARLGVGPGDRVAYLSFNNHQLLAGYFAPLLIQAVFMPLNVRLTVPELTAMLRQGKPRVLLYESEFEHIGARLKRDCPQILNFDDLPEGRIERPDLSSLDDRQTAEIFFTSGSTAQPKMVELSHRSLYLHAMSMNTALEQTPVELHAIPLFHANGWGRPHTVTMHGATHVLLRRFTPETFHKAVVQHQVTGTSLVPAMAQMLLDSTLSQPGSLQHIHLGGAPIPAGLVRKLAEKYHCRVTAGYGLTEAGPVVAVSSEGMTYSPIAGVEVQTAADGELLFRHSEDWLPTGDVVIFHGDSSFGFLDRKKDIIITGGENVASIEVEAAIDEHPAVLESAVVAAPDPKWGEMPAAFVVLNTGSILTQSELKAFLTERLARFKIPRSIEFVTGPLPRTATGKLLKRELRERFERLPGFG